MSTSNMTEVDEKTWCGEQCTQIAIVIVMLSIFSALGTVGNSLVLYVFGRRKEKPTSTIFILALAATDLITCVVIMPFTITAEVTVFDFRYDFVCKLYSFCITFGVPLSCFIMVAIAIDRYFCICHPFMHAITVPRAKIMLLSVAAFAFTLGVITALSVGTYQTMSHTVNCSTGDNASYTNITDCGQTIETVMYIKACRKNQIYFSENFRNGYQKFYASLYLVSVVIVFVLYFLIYRSVRTRRAMREKQRNATHILIANPAPENSYIETQMTALNGHEEDVDGAAKLESKNSKRERKRQIKSNRDKNKVANLKTAVMLFIVTIVFIVAFAPSWIMAQKIADMNLIVFNFYFIYNVCNPIIYAFLNQSFRDDLTNIFRCK